MAKRQPKSKKQPDTLQAILRELEALRREVEALKARPYMVPAPVRPQSPVPYYPPIDPWCIPVKPNQKYPQPIQIWC